MVLQAYSKPSALFHLVRNYLRTRETRNTIAKAPIEQVVSKTVVQVLHLIHSIGFQVSDLGDTEANQNV